MASGGMDTGVNDAVKREELNKLQQDLALAATSFNEMKCKIAGLETQLQQATLREQTKSTAHANKPDPFRGHGTTTFGLLDISLSTYSGGNQCRSDSMGFSGEYIFDRECCSVV
jgi:hypothetical protein